MGKNKVRSVVKKKKKIEELKGNLKLNEQKLKEVTVQLTAQLSIVGLQQEQTSLVVDEMELVLRLGLKMLNPVFEYETHKEWEAHAEKATKFKLSLEQKKLANYEKNIEELNKQLESQASQAETIKKETIVELKKLGLDEKDIFKQEIPSYIG